MRRRQICVLQQLGGKETRPRQLTMLSQRGQGFILPLTVVGQGKTKLPQVVLAQGHPRPIAAAVDGRRNHNDQRHQQRNHDRHVKPAETQSAGGEAWAGDSCATAATAWAARACMRRRSGRCAIGQPRRRLHLGPQRLERRQSLPPLQRRLTPLRIVLDTRIHLLLLVIVQSTKRQPSISYCIGSIMAEAVVQGPRRGSD